MPTLNKRYRTHQDIMERPREDDELEREYRSAEIRQTADKLEAQFGDTPRYYNDLLSELARRQLARSPSDEGAL